MSLDLVLLCAISSATIYSFDGRGKDASVHSRLETFLIIPFWRLRFDVNQPAFVAMSRTKTSRWCLGLNLPEPFRRCEAHEYAIL